MLGRIYEPRLGVTGRVEDFACIVLGGSHDDKASRIRHRADERGVCSHVEHADDAKDTRVPLLFVALHAGLHRVGEFANNGDCPCGAGQMALLRTIDGLFEDEKGGKDGTGGVEPSEVSFAAEGRGKSRREGVERGGRRVGGGSGRGWALEEGGHK